MESYPKAFEALQNGLPSNTYVKINKDEIREITGDATAEYRSLIQKYKSVKAARDEAAAKTKAGRPWRFVEGATREDYEFIDGEWRPREQTKKADEHETEFVAIEYNPIMKNEIGDYNYMTGSVYNKLMLDADKKILLIYNENLKQWGVNGDLRPGSANGVARKIRLDNPDVQKQFKNGKRAVVSLGVPVILSTDSKEPLEEKQLIESSFDAIKTAINTNKFDTVYYTCGDNPFEFGFKIFINVVTTQVKEIIRCQLVSLLRSNAKKIFYYTGNQLEPSVDIKGKLPKPCQDQTGTAEAEAKKGASKAELSRLFPLVIDERLLENTTHMRIKHDTCIRVSKWIPSILQCDYSGQLDIDCIQKSDVKPFTTTPVDCDRAIIDRYKHGHFSFPTSSNAVSYFGVGFSICKPNGMTCGGHGAAGYFTGKDAVIFDGASWLGQSDVVMNRLTRYFSNAGFNLTIVNKTYQTVFGNCSMFQPVCVFLIMIYGQERFYEKMEQMDPEDQNKLIECTALRMKRLAEQREAGAAEAAQKAADPSTGAGGKREKSLPPDPQLKNLKKNISKYESGCDWVKNLSNNKDFNFTALRTSEGEVTIENSPVTLYSVRDSDPIPGKAQNVITPGYVLIGGVQDLMYKYASSNKNSVNTIFQAASQFNILEMVRPSKKPDDGICNYIGDGTQGPAVAVSTGYALIFRNYFMNPAPEPNKPVGISKDGQLVSQYNGIKSVTDALQDGDYRMKNGYFFPTEKTLVEKEGVLINNLRDMTVGYHPVVQITTRDPFFSQERLGDNDKKYVGEVFTSACPIGYSKIDEDYWTEFAKKELEQSYFLTFLSALYSKKPDQEIHVILTLVGGGVFGNDPEEIVFPAIKGAIEKFQGRKDGLKITYHLNLFTRYLQEEYMTLLPTIGLSSDTFYENGRYPPLETSSVTTEPEPGGAGAVVKLTVDKQPDKGYLDKILGIYNNPAYLGAATKFVKKLWSKEVDRTMHTSRTRLIVPEEFGLPETDVISHLKNRFPVYFGYPKQAYYKDSELKNLTGFNTSEIQKNRQALDENYKGKMRYGILGWSKLNSLTGSHRPASEAWFLHTWGVNTNEDDVDLKYVFSDNDEKKILKRYKELLDRMFRVVELSAQYLHELYKNKKIIIRITGLGMGAWIYGIDDVGLTETIKDYYREKLKQIAKNNEEWLIIHHPMYPDRITIDISTEETVEKNHDPFGDSPDKVIDEKIKNLKENEETVTLIVNAWDNGSFIGNAGSEDNTMDGWTVAGGSAVNKDSFYKSQDIDETQRLGFQSQNASYLHNIYFSKHLTEEPSLWVRKSGTGGSQQAADPSTGAGGKGEDTDLPEGWKSAVDDNTNRIYYYNTSKNISQWEKPKLSPPPPPPVIFSTQAGSSRNGPSLSKFIARNLKSENRETTCYLNSVLISLLAFEDTYFLKQLNKGEECPEETARRICSINRDSFGNIKLLKEKFIEINKDLNNPNSKKIYGSNPRSSDPYRQVLDLSKLCNNLGLDSSDTGASGSYGDPFSVINFFKESVFCSINTPEVYEKISSTAKGVIMDSSGRGIEKGWKDIINDLKREESSGKNLDKKIYILNFQDQSEIQQESGRGLVGDIKNAKDLEISYMRTLVSFILSPSKDTKVLSIILYNGGHYTCLLHSEDNNWIYFDSYGGTQAWYLEDNQLIGFLTSGDFVCDFTLYMEKVNPPASFENTGLSEGSYKSPLKLKRTKYLSPTSKIKVARKKRKTNIQKLKVKK